MSSCQYLVAPILEPEDLSSERAVRQDLERKGHGWDSGRWIEIECPIESMPVLTRALKERALEEPLKM